MAKVPKKGRYIVTYYETAESKAPIGICYTDPGTGEKCFIEKSKRKIFSTVLYDQQNDRVMKFAIEGEPKPLTLAIELARGNTSNVDAIKKKENVVEAVGEIAGLAKALLGEVPGITHVVEAHLLGPYYAVLGDGAMVAQTAAGFWGGLSGTVLGLLGGPAGAVAGGLLGASLASGATRQLFKAFNHPDKCGSCNGTGLVDDYRTCKKCDGFGYITKK